MSEKETRLDESAFVWSLKSSVAMRVPYPKSVP